MYDYITQGAIIRSRATWYEFSERNNKYFWNLENSDKKKSTVRKVFNREKKLTTDPKQIMSEHFDQSAFVKERTIFDVIRTIDDVIEHTMKRDISGILVAIDFEKDFDSLTFSFLIRVLHAFNFGPSFIQWVRVLYNKVSSCVMNNGFTSGPFSLSRGVRQGGTSFSLSFHISFGNLSY